LGNKLKNELTNEPAPAIRQGAIALLGRADAPTDAVQEYCEHLRDGLLGQGISLGIERVAWAERGWRRALRSLRRHSKGWRGMWVLVQYTALAWSARGFPRQLMRVLRILKGAGLRIAVVYHDAEPFPGRRWIDRLRRRAQLRLMRAALNFCDVAVCTVPVEKLSWMRAQNGKAVFIPVGANLAPNSAGHPRKEMPSNGQLSVAVFGITGGKATAREIGEIAEAVRYAAARIKALRLMVFGRNAKETEGQLRKSLEGVPVELQVLGLLSSENVAKSLRACDVQLFVRGPISSRRGSALAGIACGVPVIAFAGPETAAPITEAGIAFYSPDKKGELGEVLLHVLQDEHYRVSLAQRCWVAQQRYFSWTAIAERYAEFLRKGSQE
jgi:glycosyltransferase involved in cell wall biosynthesis